MAINASKAGIVPARPRSGLVAWRGGVAARWPAGYDPAESLAMVKWMDFYLFIFYPRGSRLETGQRGGIEKSPPPSPTSNGVVCCAPEDAERLLRVAITSHPRSACRMLISASSTPSSTSRPGSAPRAGSRFLPELPPALRWRGRRRPGGRAPGGWWLWNAPLYALRPASRQVAQQYFTFAVPHTQQHSAPTVLGILAGAAPTSALIRVRACVCARGHL